MRVLKEKEYEDLKRLARIGQTVIQDYHWYSEYDFLNPIFDSFIGKSPYAVSSARDDFRSRFFRKYISKHDHDILMNQMALLCKTENKFPETETYHTMRKKLNDALAVIEEFKNVKLPEASKDSL